MTELEAAQERIKQLESDLTFYIERSKDAAADITTDDQRILALEETENLLCKVYESYGGEVPKAIKKLIFKITDPDDLDTERPLQLLIYEIGKIRQAAQHARCDEETE